MHPDVLDIPATAQLLGLSKSATYRLVRSGAIPAWRLGGQWRLWRPAVIRAVAGPEEAKRHPSPAEDEPKLIDIATLSDLLDVTPPTCHVLMKDGTIPSQQVGRRLRVWWPNVRQLMIEGSVVEGQGPADA